jgi:hypothetical protein
MFFLSIQTPTIVDGNSGVVGRAVLYLLKASTDLLVLYVIIFFLLDEIRTRIS